ncbi:MAG: IS91 family transposase [Burkholderiales bacterium]
MALPSPVVGGAAGEAGGTARPRFEVADVVRAYGQEYLGTHATSMEQRKVLRAIATCRTAALGGHVEQCEGCSYRRIAYNSCRNRHCDKCQGKERAQWMAAEQAMLLPVPYFHNVFTLPHALNPLIRVNRRFLLGLLFGIAARTLRSFALDPQHLGAELAVTMALHTWGQTLQEHYHVHCVVSGGGLSIDGSTWISLPKRKKRRKNKRRRPFLFHVKALSKVFRAKFIAALERARRNGKLTYIGHSAPLAQDTAWNKLTDKLWGKDWVVYSKAPCGGPEQVLKYLSRYTHRIAISNRRILSVSDAIVRFEYRDYADGYKRKVLPVAATEFLRRFLQHVLPRGFMRIRHYGITANCARGEKLARARQLLADSHNQPAPEPDTALSAPPACTETPQTDSAATRCPACGGLMRVIEVLAPTPFPYDTS